MKLKLHHYWRSSCSWRVRIALESKGIVYETMPVNLLKGEQTSAAHLERNPAGFVPALETSAGTLYDSVAIIEWLDETYQDNPLLPQSPIDRAVARAMTAIISSSTQPVQNLKVQQFISDNKEKRARFARHFIAEGLKAYEKAAQKHAGTYSFGGAVTIADLCLIPQLYNARRFQVDLTIYPNCLAIEKNCLDLPAFKNTHPDKFKNGQ